MNLEKVKVRLKEISQSTAIKNPKLLVGELCGAVQLLIAEIEKEDTKNNKKYFAKAPRSEPDHPNRTPPLVPPNRTRPLNAGDAE
jgi:hypothetical protein